MRSGRALLAAARRFIRAAEGAVLAWAAITIPAVLGVGALTIDLSRYYALQTELQNAADAAALAAAAELDGRASAITRANNALANLVSNDERFGEAGGGAVAIGAVRYLTSLPASDADPITEAFVTTDATEARFVEVRVTPVDLDFILPVFAGMAAAQTNALAVAGFQEAVCQFTPMFVCNPWEGTGTTIQQAANDPAQLRRMVALRMPGGQTSQYAPGNYGFLDAPLIGNGASALEQAIAQAAPPTCFAQSGVSVRTGQISSVRDGFNVRFDMYNGNLSGMRNNPNYRPARDVIRGYAAAGNGNGSACNSAPSAAAYGLPRDSCFATNTCQSVGSSTGGRMGAGDWDFVTYMQRNHNSPAAVTIAGTAYTINYTTRTFSPASRPSRYQVYRWEIDNNRIPNSNGYSSPGTTERGAPACYTGGGLSDTPDRRILYVAVLNCQALVAQGLLTSGNSSGPLPVEAFARIFLTEPVESGQNSTIYGEFNGIVQPGQDSAVVRDMVQLYR